MPRKEFFNLSFEKQTSIIESARKEFTSVVYEDASINKIVKDANISRGSFYCYFDNKKDIYLYIIKQEIKRIVDNVVFSSEKKLDLFEACLKLFDQIVKFYETEDKELIRNILYNMKMEFENETIEIESERIFESVSSRVSLKNIEYKSQDELLSIIGMVIHFIVEGIFLTIFKDVDCKIVRKRLQFNLNVIKKGTKKGEK